MALLTMTRRKPTADELAARREAELDAAETAEWLAELAAGQAALDEQRRAAEWRADDEQRAALAYWDSPAGRARLDGFVDAVMDRSAGWTLARARAAVPTNGRRGSRGFTDPKPVFGASFDDVAAAIVRRAPRVSLAWFQVYMRVCGCCESGAALKARWKAATGR